MVQHRIGFEERTRIGIGKARIEPVRTCIIAWSPCSLDFNMVECADDVVAAKLFNSHRDSVTYQILYNSEVACGCHPRFEIAEWGEIYQKMARQFRKVRNHVQFGMWGRGGGI